MQRFEKLKRQYVAAWFALVVAILLCASPAAAEVIPPISARYAGEQVDEVPDFQRHVVPLFGRLGCNGRSCHGSFQGRGGFRLSLFGYDFQADHEALVGGDAPRVNKEQPLESLLIAKPISEENHEGGKRYATGSWQYHVFRRWIEAGAKFDKESIHKLVTLEVTPSEIQFRSSGETVQLRAIAVWQDGTREDVTPLCRFQTNNEQVARIDELGLVTATDKGDTHVVAFYDKAVIPVPVIRPMTDLIGDKYPGVPAPTSIDQLVVAKLQKLGVVPSELCTDAEFLRRVSLDLAGTLPAPQEVAAFLADTSSDKRARKIEELLESPGYAAWWATKLCDFTGNNDTSLNNVTPVRTQASRFWYDWIHDRVSKNVPYDKIVEGIVLAVSRQEGESYSDYCRAMSEIARNKSEHSYAERSQMPYYWARSNFRQAEERVIGFSYAFMGIRIECAQCHKHPFDQWSKEDFDQFKGFFTTVSLNQNGRRDAREEYASLLKELGLDKEKKNGNQLRNELGKLLQEGKTVPFPEVHADIPKVSARKDKKDNKKRPAPVALPTARLLGGETMDLTKFKDARQPLMDWLRDRKNPFFARSIVNRVWANYFNVGIVSPPDDMSLANPPTNQPLLDFLTQGFLDHQFDLKWLHREILNSRTYQLSWVTNETNEADQRNFSHALPRRLPAEVAYDALQLATASEGRAAMLRRDVRMRAIGIPGSVARDRNTSPAQFALTVFGRSTRESNCDCDRSSDASLLQTVYLQNDRDVQTLLDRPKEGWLQEIALQVAGKSGAAAANSDDPEKREAKSKEAQQTLKSLERKIERLKKAGKEDDARPLEERLQKLLREFEKAATEPAPEQETAPAETKIQVTPEELVKQAYLRTLSRYPTDSELSRCVQYLRTSDDTVQGMRGVLWALLNTKEFIINH